MYVASAWGVGNFLWAGAGAHSDVSMKKNINNTGTTQYKPTFVIRGTIRANHSLNLQICSKALKVFLKVCEKVIKDKAQCDNHYVLETYSN